MKNNLLYYFTIILLLLAACEKEGETSFTVHTKPHGITADPSKQSIEITILSEDPWSTDSIQKNWLSLSAYSGKSGKTKIKLSLTTNNTKEERNHEIIFKYGNDSYSYPIYQQSNYSNIGQLKKWGLNDPITEIIQNNRKYTWYIDQAKTGKFSGVNCGPAVSVMAAKWYDESFSKTPVEARENIKSNGGWWSTTDIREWLNQHNIPNKTISLHNGLDVLEQTLKEGNIIILCVDMYYFRYNKTLGVRLDKFYRTNNSGWGHFLIVKGFIKSGENTFFDVYDPYNYEKLYEDETEMGACRYYRGEDVKKSTDIWWPMAIIVGNSKYRSVTKSRIMSIDDIPEQYGQ